MIRTIVELLDLLKGRKVKIIEVFYQINSFRYNDESQPETNFFKHVFVVNKKIYDACVILLYIRHLFDFEQ